MGKIGSATAIDASDIVFLNDDLSLLDWLVRKSKDTLSIVKQNITLSLVRDRLRNHPCPARARPFLDRRPLA